MGTSTVGMQDWGRIMADEGAMGGQSLELNAMLELEAVLLCLGPATAV